MPNMLPPTDEELSELNTQQQDQPVVRAGVEWTRRTLARPCQSGKVVSVAY